MARKGENIYKRKDGRYEGRYIKHRRADGTPAFGYIYARSYAEVKTRLTQAKASAKPYAGLRVIGNGTLEDFLHFWLENSVRAKVKPSTYSRYYERVRGYIIPALGRLMLCKITAGQMQAFADGLSARGLAPSTVGGITGLLRSSAKKALELGLTAENPCGSLKIPLNTPKKSSALERGEQAALERVAISSGTQAGLGVFLALYTGMRIGELCALRWKDIDLNAGTLTVSGTLQRIKSFGGGQKTAVIESAPKSRTSARTIPLPAGVTKLLERYRQGGERYVLSGESRRTEPRVLRSRFEKLARQAGLSVNFHTLRHTYATRCLENNFDIQTLSELLGHSNAGTTLRVYSHSVLEHKRRLVDRIEVLSLGK